MDGSAEQDTDAEVRGEPHPGVVRHGRLPRRRPAVFAAEAVAIAAAVVLVGAGSVAAVETWQVVRSAKPPVSLAMPGDDVRAAPALTAQSGEVNLLLVATDTRDGQETGFDDPANRAASSGVGNNDTTILVHIAADHTNMAVVSFPRDLVIPVPACTNDTGSVTPASSAAMLNTALARGGERHGLACVAKTIEQLTGLRIPYAGMITFDGVVAITDGAAEQLDAALRAGEPVVLGTDSLGRSAVLDPSASASPSAGSASSAGGQSSGSVAPSATGQPTASTSSPAPSTRSPLPDSVSGQRADTVTCAAKR